MFNNANVLSYISEYLDKTSKLNYIKAISGSKKIGSKQIRFDYVVDKNSKPQQILYNYKFVIKVEQYVHKLSEIKKQCNTFNI